jgi:hypothetical protein
MSKNKSGEVLHPITRVIVFHTIDNFNGGDMDMTTDNTITMNGLGIITSILLEVINE